MRFLRTLLVTVLTLQAAAALPFAHAGEIFYVGTFTDQQVGSRGIYRFELDPATGAVTEHGLAIQALSPAFLAPHPNGKILYAVNETDDGRVSAYAIEADGKLREMNSEASHGDSPTHLSLDKDAKHVFVANYSTGTIAVLPILDDGKLGPATCVIQQEGLGPNLDRQEGPHAHFIRPDAASHRVYVCDLGADRVFIYRFDAKAGVLTPNDPPFAMAAAGGGPRHLAFGPNEDYAYVINEMASTLTVYRNHRDTGALGAIQNVSTIPAGFWDFTTTAEVMVHPNGRFVYGSNRGHDSIAVFEIDPKNGKLWRKDLTSTQGQMPRYFGFDPTGKFIIACNADTGNAIVLRVDPETGKLTPTGHGFQCPSPVCVVFPPGR